MSGSEITVKVFKSKYKKLLKQPEYKNFRTLDAEGNTEADINTLLCLEYDGLNVVRIAEEAFKYSKFTGKLP